MERSTTLLGIGLGLLLLGMGNMLAAAGSPPPEPMQQLVDSLQSRVARLEATLARLESSPQPPDAMFLGTDSVEYLAGRGGAVYLPRQSLSGRLPQPLPAPQVETAAAVAHALELSGYFEGVCRMEPKDGRNNTARLNQAELDLGRELGNRTRADLGIYYNEEFSVCWATVSYAALSAGEDGPNGRALSDINITAGQFDIPFGMDYLSYAPLDRPLATMPRPVAASYGWWNDVGVMAGLGGAPGSLDVYAVKGLSTTLWNSDEDMPVDVTTDDERWQTVQPAMCGGLRLDLKPWPDIDGGCSLARGWNRSGGSALSLAGLHLQRSTERLTVKAEGIISALAEDVQPQRMRGAYLEATERFGRPFLVERVDYLHREGEERERGFSFGGGFRITEGVEFRSEYGWETGTRTSDIYLQLVAGF